MQRIHAVRLGNVASRKKKKKCIITARKRPIQVDMNQASSKTKQKIYSSAKCKQLTD